MVENPLQVHLGYIPSNWFGVLLLLLLLYYDVALYLGSMIWRNDQCLAALQFGLCIALDVELTI
jgi:hypothetical protein